MKVLEISADLSITNGNDLLQVKNAEDGSLRIDLSGPSLIRHLPGKRRIWRKQLMEYSRQLKNAIVVYISGKPLMHVDQGNLRILNWPMAFRLIVKNWLNI